MGGSTRSGLNPEAHLSLFPQVTSHRHDDDLLTAGLGLAGLRAPAAPALARAEAPTPAELRRRAVWQSWRGIADLTPGGGFGEVYGSAADVPGREYAAFATLPGARHPHRIVVQVPDAFDRARRCLLVAPSSGSRGAYGAIAVAGAWGLPKGCAVAYTDKGAGSDYVDLVAGCGVRLDGTRAPLDAGGLAFVPATAAGVRGVALKHAHSGDNPEADWGRHVRQAAEYGLRALDEAFPAQAPFTFANTRIVAVGISNGGGAVLRAAELDDGAGGDWLDAVVAGAPSVLVDAPGARALYDYATEALLHMPDALQALMQDGAPAQARAALARMRAGGWTDEALRGGASSVAFDLWRSIAVTYASAYGRCGVDEHPCGFGFSEVDGDGFPRPATADARTLWWCDASGIPPGAGVAIVDPPSAHPAGMAPLQSLRALWTGDAQIARRVRAGVAATQAGIPRAELPVTVIHGVDDGLIPLAFASAPYVAQTRAAGRNVRFLQVRNVQHFDAFLGFPDHAARYLPMLAYVHHALDRVAAALDGQAGWPADAVIDTAPRGGAPLSARHLALP